MLKTVKGIDIPVIGFAAYSGTGKTTLITHIIRILAERNLRVGTVKHSHHKFDIDYPGKDSYRMREAGASQVLIGSSQRWALMVEHDIKEYRPLEYHLHKFDLANLDLVLVEGFKVGRLPKIEVYRPALGNPALHKQDKYIVAVATDDPASVDTDLPVFDLGDPGAIADFIIERYLDNVVLLERRQLKKDL